MARRQLGAAPSADEDAARHGDVAAVDINTVASTGATETIDFAHGADTQVHDLTMDQNCTFSFGNAPASGTLGTMTVLLKGAFTPTFPAAVDWADGTAPSYDAPAIYEFWTIDGGTTVFGHLAGAGMA